MLLAPDSLLHLLVVSVYFSHIGVETELLAQPYPPHRTGEFHAVVSESVSYTQALGLAHWARAPDCTVPQTPSPLGMAYSLLRRYVSTA